MQNALICLEKLGIGGVETFTITQVDEFSKRGIHCVVLARKGLLLEHILNKKNIEFIEFDFPLQNSFDFQKSKEIEKIVKEKKIDFIYVHQFPCALYIMPVVWKLKIPYIAYLHNIVPHTCEWYMDTYNIYQILFPLFFANASKLIAITDRVKEEHKALFHFPEERYITIHNSLDFKKFPNHKVKKINTSYDRLLLFGRVSEQKRNSIETAVSFFHYLKEKNPKVTLTIVGDGEIFEEMVAKYGKEEGITFKGALPDMKDEIEKADILLGVDRCMLEAVASKKPAIICGYRRNIVLITPKNLQQAVVENFTGINLGDDRDEIFRYNEKELIKILDENYDYVFKNLSITTSVYLDIAPFPETFEIGNFFEILNNYVKEIDHQKQIADEIYQEKERLIGEIEKRDEIIQKSGIKGCLRGIRDKFKER